MRSPVFGSLFKTDGRGALTLGALHFLISAAYSQFDIATTALLVATSGADALPRAYLAGALSLIAVGVLVIPWIDRIDRKHLFTWFLLGFAFIILAARQAVPLTGEWVYPALYVLSFSMKSLLFLMFWLLAGDLVDPRRAKRLFPSLLGFSLAGGLLGSIFASVATRFIPTESLLATSAGLLLMSLVALRLTATAGSKPAGSRPRTVANEPGTRADRFRKDLRASMGSPMLKALSAGLLLFATASQMMDYLTASAADSFYGGDPESLASFFAVLNVAVIGIGAVFQFVFARRLIATIGVTGGQILAPLILILAFGSILIVSRLQAPSGLFFFLTVVLARAIQRIVRISVFRSSTDLLYNALSSDSRGRAKAFKETWLEPTGVLLGGMVLLLSRTVGLQNTVIAGLVVAIVFLWVSFRLKGRYTESLLGILEEKSRFRFAFPSAIMKAKPDRDASISALRTALSDESAPVRLLAVELASELSEPAAARLLIDRFQKEADPAVRLRMLSALSRVYHARRSRLGSPSEREPVARASGILSMAEMGFGSPEADPDREPTAVAAPVGLIRQLETDAANELAALVKSKDPKAAPRLMEYLERGTGAVRHAAVRAIMKCGDVGVDCLTLALWGVDIIPRSYVIHALGQLDSRASREVLHPALNLEGEQARHELAQLSVLLRLEGTGSLDVLRQCLVERVARARANAHQILRLVFRRQSGMRIIVTNLDHPDPFVRASAIEALEIRDDSGFLEHVLTLFEERDLVRLARQGTVEASERDRERVLEQLARHRSTWVRCLAIRCVGERYEIRRVSGERQVRLMQDRLSDSDWLCRVNAFEALVRWQKINVTSHLASLDDEANAQELNEAKLRLHALSGKEKR